VFEVVSFVVPRLEKTTPGSIIRGNCFPKLPYTIRPQIMVWRFVLFCFVKVHVVKQKLNGRYTIWKARYWN
jgi:hypothetical protein